MGFNIERRTAKLLLHGDYEGAWVRVRLDIPMGVAFELSRRGRDLQSTQEIDNVEALFGMFAKDFLIDWNLEEEHIPLPPSAEGMAKLSLNLAVAIMTATMEAVAQPPTPLSLPSVNGSTSGETVLPSLSRLV